MPKGKHVNHARGSRSHLWTDGRIVASNGYARVRVGRSHPLADPNGYCYEHLLVWVGAGNPRPGPGLVLHHASGDKLDNRIENLSLISRQDHAREHFDMLPNEAVREIRERYERGEHSGILEAAYGVPRSRILRFVRGETRRDAGGPIQTGPLRGKRTPAATGTHQQRRGNAPLPTTDGAA